MFPAVTSNSNRASEESNTIDDSSSPTRVHQLVFGSLNSSMLQINSLPIGNHQHEQPQQKIRKKRNLPGNPDPDAEVIALSPTTLLATNRFVCEICNKGFQRDQNLQLHRRGHNLPWKLKQRNSKENRKRAYVCPEPTCLHHHPSRALGDLTGIKKHYCRKHGEKKWKCEKCEKIYAVQSDWKAHSKTCGTREYKCDCGTIFSRKDSFITHRAFCDALAEESARLSAATNSILPLPNPNNYNNTLTATEPFHLSPQNLPPPPPPLLPFSAHHRLFRNPMWDLPAQNPNPNNIPHSLQLINQLIHIKDEPHHMPSTPLYPPPSLYHHQDRNHLMMTSSPFGSLHVSTAQPPPTLSATALLQKAASMGPSGHISTSSMANLDLHAWQKSDDGFTRDFLGLTGHGGGGDGSDDGDVREVISFTRGLKIPSIYDRDDDHHSSVMKNHGFGFTSGTISGWGDC